MPRLKIDDGLTKARRFRAAQQDRGMKLLRVWVPDTKSAAFAAQAAEQAARLRGRPEEAEALAFIDAAFAWPPM